MGICVRSRLIRIGNSQGIRIPRLLIEELGLSGEVELEAQPGQLVVRPARRVREGWDGRFAAMAEAGADRLLDGDALVPTEWDGHEWQW